MSIGLLTVGAVMAHRARHCVPREVHFLDELPRSRTGDQSVVTTSDAPGGECSVGP